MELNQDFKEFIALLNAHKVRFLVIGGYAVNYHGYPRYTKDIDFWVWLNETNLEHLLAALKDLIIPLHFPNATITHRLYTLTFRHLQILLLQHKSVLAN
jgi:hypothetical protein